MFKIDRAIDTFNEKIGYYASYLVLPLIGVVVCEVFMRYGFNAPTSWAFELTVFLYGVHYSLPWPMPTSTTPMSQSMSLKRDCRKDRGLSCASSPTGACLSRRSAC